MRLSGRLGPLSGVAPATLVWVGRASGRCAFPYVVAWGVAASSGRPLGGWCLPLFWSSIALSFWVARLGRGPGGGPGCGELLPRGLWVRDVSVLDGEWVPAYWVLLPRRAVCRVYCDFAGCATCCRGRLFGAWCRGIAVRLLVLSLPSFFWWWLCGCWYFGAEPSGCSCCGLLVLPFPFFSWVFLDMWPLLARGFSLVGCPCAPLFRCLLALFLLRGLFLL